ncbi:MAG: hypothetical protein AAGI92_04790 [Pseudomonadota bacterium]
MIKGDQDGDGVADVSLYVGGNITNEVGSSLSLQSLYFASIFNSGSPGAYNSGGGTAGTNGSSGIFGGAGTQGADGLSGDFLNLGTGTGVLPLADTVVYAHGSDTEITEGSGGTNTVTFDINRIGDQSEALVVLWEVVSTSGGTSADFTGGALPSGAVTFTAGGTFTGESIQVSFDIATDLLAEFDETFEFRLTGIGDPVGGPVAQPGVGRFEPRRSGHDIHHGWQFFC